MKQAIQASFSEASAALDQLRSNDAELLHIEQFVGLLVATFKADCKVIACGNGGSMCDAMHFTEELSGKFRHERPGLAAIALSDPGFLTCVANDFGYQKVFSRGVEALGRPGDLLVAFSASGKSPNIVAALATARELGLQTVLLTGHEVPRDLADLVIQTKAGRYADRVQELHIKIVHIVIELVERGLFGEA